MESFKNFKVWDGENQKLVNRYENGTKEFYMARAIIASVRAAESISITPEQIFSRGRTAELSVLRGLMMVSVFGALSRFKDSVGAARIASAVFGRDRATLYHFKRIADSKKDAKFEEVRNSYVGKKIKASMAVFLNKIGLGAYPITTDDLLVIISACPVCKAKLKELT